MYKASLRQKRGCYFLLGVGMSPLPITRYQTPDNNKKSSRQVEVNQNSLTTFVDNCPHTSFRAHTSTSFGSKASSIGATGHYCQDSTHLPLEPYISCKVFEQYLLQSIFKNYNFHY